MKYVFVGDIHGKVEQVEKALAMEGQKIFVGDFMDSFDRPTRDHARCLRLVLDAIKENEAQALFGNHELSYMMSNHVCSGWKQSNNSIMQAYQPEINEHFKHFLWLEDSILVTHAGLSKWLWDKYSLNKENLVQTLSAWILDRYSPAHYIGWYRGGRDVCGGIYWCDFDKEFVSVPELTQVFGHTPGKDIRQIENSFCIDCLDHKSEFLVMDI